MTASLRPSLPSQPVARRGGEVARLREVLDHPAPGLSIVGISGPGGVGKSYFLDAVLSATPTEQSKRWLKLSVDGSNKEALGDFFALLEQLTPRSLPPPAKPKHDYFPRVRKIASLHRAILDDAAAELDATAASATQKLAAMEMLKLGRRLNKVLPKTRAYVDVTCVTDTDLDEVWKVVTRLRALRVPTGLSGAVRNVVGLTDVTRVKHDLYNLTAESLLTDLSAAIGGYLKKDWKRLAQSPIDGIDRLLLVIDDFEALAPALQEFLVVALVPHFVEAQFPVTLVILCRDDLDAMDPAWNQHWRRYIRDQIRLAPLDREAALDLLASAGVPEARRESMFESTQGLPFLLNLLVDELGAEGADSALFLRKFFDRTTRWLTDREREWFMRICHLESVNLDTLGPLFPGDDVEMILDWFEREASIRDPAAPVFRVRPLIREKVLRYLELRSPSRHREMLERVGG